MRRERSDAWTHAPAGWRKLAPVAVAMAALAACTPGRSGGDDAPGPEHRVEVLREIQLTDQARLPESDGQLVDVEIHPDRLVFIYSAPPAVGFDVGQVVSGVLHGGYLRRVTAVRELSPTRIETMTVAAELGELIGDGHFVVHFDPRSGESSFRVSDGVGLTTGALDSGWSLITPEYRNFRCSGGEGGTTDIRPSFDMDTDAVFEVDLRWEREGWSLPRGVLHSARFELSGQIEAGITVATTSNASISCRWAPELPKREWATVVPVGPVPVALTHEIAPAFEISVSGSVQTGASTANATGRIGVRAGAQYTRGSGWAPIWEPTRDGSTSLEVGERGMLTVTVTAKTGIGYTVKVYDTLGPGISLDPSISGSFTVNDCAWQAEAKAGIALTGSAELTIPVFDYTLADYSLSQSLVEGTIAEDSGSFFWCDDAGMPDGGTTMPPADGGTPGIDGGSGGDAGTSDPCATAGSTCEECNMRAGCGFCDGTCMADSRRGECGGIWKDSPSSCVDTCGSHGSCTDCTLDAFCGWCPGAGQCVTAPSAGEASPCADLQYGVASCGG